MFNQLLAVCLIVHDFEKSLDFYKNMLNLKLNTQDGKFADFKLEGTSLAIFQQDEATNMFPKQYMKSGSNAVLAFQVENIEKECKTLVRKGLEIFEGPKKTPWGQTVAYFKDPDGYIWEISNKS
jgi:lactoylglutathione lyase